MFKIIGIDGRQYGPVDAEQIKRWIAAGRADASTNIQAEGSHDWKPLADVPEFAEALAAKAAPPQPEAPSPQSTPSPPQSADLNALAQFIATRGFAIDVGSCLGRAWDKMMTDLWIIMGISALVWLALSACHAVYLGIVLTGPLLGGLYYYYLKKIRGQTAELLDAFAGFT